MRRLIILRPEPGGSASVERARKLGIDAEAIPLFEVRPLAWTVPDPTGFDALLMTSANAARHGGPELARLTDLPVHAVGEATAEAARSAGFTVATIGTGGAAELVAALAPGVRLLHLAGRHRREVPAAHRIAVYEAVELPAPDIRGAGAVIAVHSPRAGKRLGQLVDDRSNITLAAISEAASEACGEGWQRVEVADRADDASLLALAARLCKE